MENTTISQGPRERKAEKLFELADRQAGYFTAKQALEAGYGYPLQHYHRERGHWIPVGHGLFRLRRYPERENEDLVRMCLWSRDREDEPQAVASHETALRLYGLSDLMPEKMHLSVPSDFRKRPPEGVVLHKADLVEADVEEWDGFRVTTPLRTILDVVRSREISPEHLESAVQEAVTRGLVRRKRLLGELSRLEDDERREIAEEAICRTTAQ
ncbi:MAG: type IV toxin-antitoxin system AbiEi family antitoxin domain-containing protein [Actinomycetota bacterium]|nr:type IV toxin-antitoxin system AbiEi family antitoxin domain-containing protein [Actinomycetota bacterium]